MRENRHSVNRTPTPHTRGRRGPSWLLAFVFVPHPTHTWEKAAAVLVGDRIVPPPHTHVGDGADCARAMNVCLPHPTHTWETVQVNRPAIR